MTTQNIPPSAEVENEDLLRRITKLLNLAGNNPSENEAHAAMVKAQEMMLGHGITMAEVASFDGESRVKVEATYAEYHCDTGSSSVATWRAYLAWYVAKYMGGKAIRTRSHGVKSHGTFQLGKMTFFALGDETLESMIEVHRYLELQLDLMSANAMRTRPTEEVFDYKTGTYKHIRRGGHAWRLAWLAGAVERIEERLKEQYQRIEAEGDNSKALVLVKDVIEDKVAEVFGVTSYTRARRRNYHRGAFQAGRQAANRVDLGGAKLDRGQGALPA